ncbi:MAG: FAD-dependent protein [Thomasclavelia ramosa]
MGPEDFASSHPLAGITYQRELEQKAFELGGKDYSVPVMRVEDYLNDTLDLKMEEVSCSVQPNVRYAKLSQIFSNEVNLALKEGLQLMNHKFTGFTEKAMLSGVESEVQHQYAYIVMNFQKY